MALAAINAAGLGDNSVIAAVAGKKIRVRGLSLWHGDSTATVAKWRSGTVDISGTIALPAAAGFYGQLAAPPPAFLFGTVAGQALVLNLTMASAVGGLLDFTLE